MVLAVKGEAHNGMKQGSEVWKDLRSCFITGSQYHAWTRPSHLAIYKKVVAEKSAHWKGVAGKPTPKALQRMFDWGHFHEGVARQNYTSRLVTQFPTQNVSVRDHVAMFIDDEGMIAASPDGIVTITNEPSGVIEIKCPTGNFFWKRKDITDPKYDVANLDKTGLDSLYREMANSEVGAKYYDMDNQLRIGGKLEDHYLQCLGNLHLSNAEWCDYIVFAPFTEWYRAKDGTRSNMRVKRLTKKDTLADWEVTLSALENAYKDNVDVFTENVESYLAKYHNTDFGPGV